MPKVCRGLHFSALAFPWQAATQLFSSIEEETGAAPMATRMLANFQTVFQRIGLVLIATRVLGDSMRTHHSAAAAALACALCFATAAKADTIDTSIGSQHFTAGTKVTSAAYAAAVSGQPAPFNAFCGSDTSSNCSTSWIFNYAIPSGDTITGATLTLGILDIDSAAAGNQVGSFTLNGSDNLTGLLNTASEGVEGGAGSPNSYYEVLSITIPGTDLTALLGGSATFALALSGPGLGVLGTTTFNGAGLDFSTLDITASAGSTPPPPPVPEPSAATLLVTGIVALSLRALVSRQS